MEAAVSYRGQEVGTVCVTQDGRGLTFHADCRAAGTQVLRLYALADGQPVRIGVLEPDGSRWTLTRSWSADAMRRLGVHGMPAVYYLDDGKGGCLPAGNRAETVPACPRLAQAVRQGAAQWQADEQGGRVCAPFVPGQAQPLAFALTACEICRQGDGYIAVLRCADVQKI